MATKTTKARTRKPRTSAPKRHVPVDGIGHARCPECGRGMDYGSDWRTPVCPVCDDPDPETLLAAHRDVARVLVRLRPLAGELRRLAAECRDRGDPNDWADALTAAYWSANTALDIVGSEIVYGVTEDAEAELAAEAPATT